MPAVAQHLPHHPVTDGSDSRTLNIQQCPGCGLVQIPGDPVPYYREVIRATSVSVPMRRFRLRQFTGFVDRFGLSGKKILEPGCGRGEYLEIINQAGARGYGLEYSRHAVQDCRRRGLHVRQGFLDRADTVLDEAPFDAFMILNVFEHHPEPGTLLQAIGRNITDNGIGLVEVPNFEMILAQRLFSEFTADHLCYFTRDTLRTAVELNGFSVVDTRTIWNDYILSMTVKRRQPINADGFHRSWKNLCYAMDRFIASLSSDRVAVWGAGHQALALISLLDLSDKIRYVVDSAPFKQNRFTPATHIPIVSPTRLDEDPVEGLIIMVAGFNDEVAGIVTREYPHIKRICLVRENHLEIMDREHPV